MNLNRYIESLETKMIFKTFNIGMCCLCFKNFMVFFFSFSNHVIFFELFSNHVIEIVRNFLKTAFSFISLHNYIYIFLKLFYFIYSLYLKYNNISFNDRLNNKRWGEF